jgi:hypothetical protein
VNVPAAHVLHLQLALTWTIEPLGIA